MLESCCKSSYCTRMSQPMPWNLSEKTGNIATNSTFTADFLLTADYFYLYHTLSLILIFWVSTPQEQYTRTTLSLTVLCLTPSSFKSMHSPHSRVNKTLNAGDILSQDKHCMNLYLQSHNHASHANPLLKGRDLHKYMLNFIYYI